jgi:hypothetical protein
MMSDYDLTTDPKTTTENMSKNENEQFANKPIPDIPFWSENPNVLLNTNYIMEFFPTDNMSYAQKLNAITRLIFVLSIIGFILYKNMRILVVSAITLFSIHLIYSHHKKIHNKSAKYNTLEGFETPATDVLDDHGKILSPETFDVPTTENPFSNVMLNDYDYNPNKKPAPPIAKQEVRDNILAEAKSMVQKLNPGQPNIADKLFRDLGEQYVFEQSLRPFYSTASTTIPNDQSGFADFCYGGMISCKEGNLFACARGNASKHINQ